MHNTVILDLCSCGLLLFSIGVLVEVFCFFISCIISGKALCRAEVGPAFLPDSLWFELLYCIGLLCVSVYYPHLFLIFFFLTMVFFLLFVFFSVFDYKFFSARVCIYFSLVQSDMYWGCEWVVSLWPIGVCSFKTLWQSQGCVSIHTIILRGGGVGSKNP